MRLLRVDNYVISTPIIEILERLRIENPLGKLKDIISKGDNIVITCPSHGGGHESKPAMNVYIGEDREIEYGYSRCFVCGFQGPFYKMVAEVFERSEDFAKKWLITNYGKLAYTTIDLGEDIKLPSSKPIFKGLNENILNSNNYQSWCPYLAKRKLSRELCNKFNLRYDAYNREIIFPCYDINGKLFTLLKRSIDTKTFHIAKDIKKPLYGIDQVYKNKLNKILITEGLFDRLVSEQYGVPAIATLGDPSDEQIELINKSTISILYLAFDNDAAGRHFTDILKQKLSPRILTVDVYIPSPFKDIGDLDYETFWTIINQAKLR